MPPASCLIVELWTAAEHVAPSMNLRDVASTVWALAKLDMRSFILLLLGTVCLLTPFVICFDIEMSQFSALSASPVYSWSMMSASL
jgi:hypothetical protein